MDMNPERKYGSVVKLPVGNLRLSTKKERFNGTPLNSIPRPTFSRTAPLFRKHLENSSVAKSVSKLRGADQDLSSLYDSSISSTYFNQCFKCHEFIGRGSFGHVYEVQSLDDGRTYAVKVSKEPFRSERERLRYCQEPLKYQEIGPHTNIVNFIRSWEEDKFLYIQMEFCPISLSSYLDTEQEVSEVFVWNMAADMCSALSHIHNRNLLHLDVKPENIFISRDNVFKLGDLGLISDTRCSDLDSDHSIGDAKYLAPEMLKGIRSRKADIFSLGMSLLEVAADLDLPGSGPLWHSLRSGSLPTDHLSNVSPRIQLLIKTMIQPDPNDRPDASKILNDPGLTIVIQRRRRTLKWISIRSRFHDVKVTCQWKIELLIRPMREYLMGTFFFKQFVNPFLGWVYSKPELNETPPRDRASKSSCSAYADSKMTPPSVPIRSHKKSSHSAAICRDELLDSPEIKKTPSIYEIATPLAFEKSHSSATDGQDAKSITGTRLNFDCLE